MAAFLLFVSMSVALTGYGCQSSAPSNVMDADQIQNSINLQVARARSELRKEFAEESAAAIAEFSEDSFVQFNVSYPRDWAVQHTADSVTFANHKNPELNGSRFSVMKTKPYKAGSDSHFKVVSEVVTSTWNGYDTERFTIEEDEAGWQTVYLQVYPEHYRKGDSIIVLAGDPSHFDTILNTIQRFTIRE